MLIIEIQGEPVVAFVPCAAFISMEHAENLNRGRLSAGIENRRGMNLKGIGIGHDFQIHIFVQAAVWVKSQCMPGIDQGRH